MRNCLFALLAMLSLWLPQARAEDSWEKAFPEDSSVDLVLEGNISAAEIGFGTKAISVGNKLAGKEVGTDKWMAEQVEELAEAKVRDAEPAVRDFLTKKERLDDLDLSASLRDLTAPELEEQQALKSYMDSAPGKTISEADRLVSLEESKILKTGSITLQDQSILSREEFAAKAARRAKIIRVLVGMGGFALIADGSARLGLAVYGRDPGYSPLLVSGETVMDSLVGDAEAEEAPSFRGDPLPEPIGMEALPRHQRQ
jgi:hypothetical protein